MEGHFEMQKQEKTIKRCALKITSQNLKFIFKFQFISKAILFASFILELFYPLFHIGFKFILFAFTSIHSYRHKQKQKQTVSFLFFWHFFLSSLHSLSHHVHQFFEGLWILHSKLLQLLQLFHCWTLSAHTCHTSHAAHVHASHVHAAHVHSWETAKTTESQTLCKFSHHWTHCSLKSDHFVLQMILEFHYFIKKMYFMRPEDRLHQSRDVPRILNQRCKR
jgi:hypothetical protein